MNIPVVILAGGAGTRLSEETELKPKPLVPIGGMPILWHIMKTYAAYGYREFIIALGYKGHLIKDFFVHYHEHNSDLTVNTKKGSIKLNRAPHEDWTVHLVDTGLSTGTGGRIQYLKNYIGKRPFLMTYGDGVADVDLVALLKQHRRQKNIATLTAVRPPARFGNLTFKGAKVIFSEKPQLAEGWINGGFFVLDPEIFDFIGDDESVMFERGPLERVSAKGKLGAYTHEGFWQCMDTLRDVKLLNECWEQGKAGWKIWK